MNRLLKVCVLTGVIAWLGASAANAQIIFGAAYVGSSSTANLYSINPTTGAGTLIGSTGLRQLSALDFNPTTGVLYGVGVTPTGGNVVLATFNTSTGASTTIGTIWTTATGDPFQDLAFGSNGTLYGLSGGDLYTVNLTTGAATQIGSGTGDFYGDGLSFGAGGVLYMGTYSGSGPSDFGVFSVNTTTGVSTLVNDIVFPGTYPTNLSDIPRIVALGFHPLSGTMYATVIAGTGGGGDLVSYFATLNTSTGVVTNIGQTVAGMDAIAIYAIPEPSVVALMIAGLGLLGWRARRRAA